MNNMNEKSEQHQNDSNVNGSLYNQSDSFLGHDQVLKHEQQHWDIKPDPYFQLKQELTPGLSLKSELTDSTLDILSQHEYPANTPMASSKEYNGLLMFTLSFLIMLEIQNLNLNVK